MFNDGNVNPGRLKAPTVMLAGVVAAGMFNDGNVNPGRLKAPTVMLARAANGAHRHRRRLIARFLLAPQTARIVTGVV